MTQPISPIKFTFIKEERLCSKRLLDEVFTKGKYHNQLPLKIVWIENNLYTEMPAQIVISVPKKNFKKAVHRNLLKRRIREAYRKNKHILYEYLQQKNIHMAIGVIYSSAELVDYFEIEEKLVLLLHKIIKEHAKRN